MEQKINNLKYNFMQNAGSRLMAACILHFVVGFGTLTSGKPMLEIWNNFGNMHPNGTPIWPFMFISVACGAISGFHSTQSPLMARCLKRQGLVI
jgi:carbon starvation protein CstA